MEPVTTTVIILYVAQKFLDQFIKDEGYGRVKKFLFPQKRYINRLTQLISQTVKEYKEAYPPNLPEGKMAFYQSQVVFEKLTTILLKTKLSSEFKFELSKNTQIEIPSEEQLRCFLDILANKIKTDKELKKLFIQENYQAEIFEISSTLVRIEEKIDTLLNRPYDSNILAISLADSYLKDLDYPADLMENYKPRQALDFLLQFKTHKWESSDNLIKYKVLVNIGQCHLQLHDQDAASKYLIEAVLYNQESTQALGFCALGHALAGNEEEFKRVYEKAIKHDEVNALIYVSLIMLEHPESSIQDIQEKIPTESQNESQIAFAIARHLKRQGNLPECMYWMQVAIDNDTKGRPELKGFLGGYILELVCTTEMFLTRQISFESRELIQKGIDLITETWNGIVDPDLRKANFYMILNRGVGKKFLGDFKGAYTDIKEASTLNDDLSTLRHLAIVAMENGKMPEAISVFETILIRSNEFSEEHRIDLLLADCYITSNQSEDAISCIKSVLEKESDSRRVNEARSILIDIFINDKRLDDAKSENRIILENYPDHIIGYLNEVHIANAEGNKTGVSENFHKAVNCINETTSHEEIYVLGNNAFVNSEFDVAIECFEKIINLNACSDIVKRLIMSHYNLGQFEKVAKICEKLRLNGIYEIAIIDTESSIYQSMSNIPKAIIICEEYLAFDPNSNPINAKVAFLYYQLMNNVKCIEALKKIDSLEGMPLPEAFQVAKLHIQMGLISEGLEYLYSLWRNNLNKAEVHNLYFTSLLFLPEEASAFLETTTVSIGTAVTVKMNGNIVEYFLVDANADITLGELDISGSLAKKLLGKSVGDSIDIDDKMGIVKTAEVTHIASKFNFARKKSMDLIQSTFIENDGPRVFTAEGETDEQRTESMFNQMNSHLDGVQQIDNELIGFYKSGVCTIGLFSDSKGYNPIEIWAGVVNDDEMGVFATNCANNEYETAHSLIQNNNPIILDLTSILALQSLSALDKLKLLPNKRIASQAMVETIRNYILENSRIGDQGSMSIGKRGDQIFVNHITGEQIKAQTNKIQNLLDWITEKCDVLPATEVITLDNESRKEIFDLSGKISAESILLTSEHNGLLLSDEMPVRLIGKEKKKIKGANIQMLLRSLMESQYISREDYDEYSVQLTSMNYKGLMVEPSTLLLSLKKSNNEIKTPFTKVITVLEGQNSEENGAINVAVIFLKQLYLSQQIPSTRDAVSIRIFETLLKGRLTSTVILKMKAFIQREFNLLPVQKADLLLLIDKWQSN